MGIATFSLTTQSNEYYIIAVRAKLFKSWARLALIAVFSFAVKVITNDNVSQEQQFLYKLAGNQHLGPLA